MIASLLNRSDLAFQADRTDYPKWGSVCLFKFLKIPTLDAAFVPKDSSHSNLATTLDKFVCLHNLSRVMVRSDGGREKATYYRGGKTLPLDLALTEAQYLLSLDRTVIFVEPTNRFQNLCSVNITLNSDGTWYGEALGPGYDTSDLQRGLVTPKWLIRSQNRSNRLRSDQFIRRHSLEVATNQTDVQRQQARLISVADLLDIKNGSKPEERSQSAKKFLDKSGFLRLFEDVDFDVDHTVKLALRYAGRVYEHIQFQANLFPVTIAAATLWDERFVFWDLTYGNLKWAMSGKAETKQ